VNGKEYVIESIELVGTIISAIKEKKLLDGDAAVADAEKACEELSGVKNKPTLRSKDGTNLAFPLYDAAQNLEEAWEDAQVNDDVDDLKWRVESFVDATLALITGLKGKTVIMT
jgi:hypothetical protein